MLTRVYPNGFLLMLIIFTLGGMSFLIYTFFENHLLHNDVNTPLGFGLEKYTQEPKIKNNKLIWEEGPKNL